MTSTIQWHASVPPYTRNLAAKDQIKWSAEFEVPAIGDDVVIRMNNIGRAKVVGYASHDGYLGVMSVPYTPPDWWAQQNSATGANHTALAFGAEISPVVALESREGE